MYVFITVYNSIEGLQEPIGSPRKNCCGHVRATSHAFMGRKNTESALLKQGIRTIYPTSEKHGRMLCTYFISVNSVLRAVREYGLSLQ